MSRVRLMLAALSLSALCACSTTRSAIPAPPVKAEAPKPPPALMVRPPKLSTLPDPKAELDNDAPSDVALSVLVGATVEIANTYNIVADRLVRLQDWVSDQVILHDGTPPPAK